MVLQYPKIVSIHCVAHRLALALGGAAKLIMDVGSVLDTLDSVYRYYRKSHVRTSTFRTVQVSCEMQFLQVQV